MLSSFSVRLSIKHYVKYYLKPFFSSKRNNHIQKLENQFNFIVFSN